MKDFFAVGLTSGDGLGFSLYSAEHIFFVVMAGAVTAGLCIFARRSGAARFVGFRSALGAITLFCEIIRNINLAAGGAMGISYLPLHLCSLAVFFSFFHSLFPRETLGNFLYSLCMPGAAFAILFPDWTAYPPFCLHSIIGFAAHTLLVAYPLCCVFSKSFTPCAKLLPRCFGILLLVAAPVYAFDRAFDVNYMFLMYPAPASPLSFFAEILGPRLYVLGYLPMIALVWTALYAPFWKKREGARSAGAYLPPLS